MRAFLQQIGSREFRLLLAGIGAVLTAIAVIVVVVPNAKAYRAASRTVEVLEKASQDGGALEKHLQNRNAKIRELEVRLHGDMANLPVRQVEAYIIGRLQRISWQNDVELVSVEPATGERVQIFEEILFNVQLIGEYSDLYRWLWQARKELGFVVVKKYGLTRHDHMDENPRLLAELSLASYRAQE